MATLQELEAPIDAEIVGLIVEVTPTWWKAARLEVERRAHEGSAEGLAHTMTSPEGHRDLVVATDEILDATHRLAELFRSFGRPWTRVVYDVTERPDGSWDYRATFTY